MTRLALGPAMFAILDLLMPALAAAQGEPPAPAEPPPATLPSTAPPPAAIAPATPAIEAAPVAPPALALADLSGAVGFGVGVIPSTQLAGTTGAVSIKYWMSDKLALAPLLSFAYAKPSDNDAAWHLQPEVVVLFVPLSGRSTRLELGGGVGFEISRAAPTTNAAGMGLQPNTVFTLAVPIQAGVEHFFSRWFSLGIAARAPLFSYAKDGGYHEVAFSIDSTSLLGQLFFYTD